MDKNAKLKIEYMPIDKLKSYEKNARKHADIDVNAIAASIEKFGFDDPIGVWSDKNIIVEEHGRLMAAKKLGMKEVPVVSVEGMSDEEIFLNDYREYEVDGRSFAIGCIDAYDTDDAEDLSERMHNIMPGILSSGGMEFGYAQIGVHTDDIDASYIVASDDTAKEILKAAFNDDNDFEGNVFIISPSISRKKTLFMHRH